MSRRHRIRPLIFTAVGTTAVAVLAGCSSTTPSQDAAPTSNTHKVRATPPPTGAVTTTQAKAIVDHYVAVNNKANATRSPKLLSTVEGGQLFLRSKADFEQWSTMKAKDQREYQRPFYYTDRTYIIPAGQSWFAVKTKGSRSKVPSFIIFDKDHSGGWKCTAALALWSPLPKIDTSNHKLATAVHVTKEVNGLAPEGLNQAYEDLFVTGGKGAGKALSLTNETAKSALKVHQERPAGRDGKLTTKYFTQQAAQEDKVYTLKLSDGGTLALAPTAHSSTYAIKPQFANQFEITPLREEAIYTPGRRMEVDDTFQGEVLAVLPTHGKARLISSEYQMTDSH
ncbi:hypothetical protein OG285_32340 [Streptomyces sp. NBC_01471]|uniref:hypothetical protein n=1 Tax=Streptomyces sp. NBC_01471 TaxID=2903879 RepID=UPI00324E4818